MDQRHGKQNKGRRSRRIPAAAVTLVMAAGALLFVKRSVDLYRERQVIELRYGLCNRLPLTQREVADQLHISRSYVSRIEKRALGLLRREFERGKRMQ